MKHRIESDVVDVVSGNVLFILYMKCKQTKTVPTTLSCYHLTRCVMM